MAIKSKEEELESVNKARQRVGKKPLYLVKGERYEYYLKNFEKKKYSAELLKFKLGK